MREFSLDIRRLHALYAQDPENLLRVLESLRQRIDEHPYPAMWISKVPWDLVIVRAQAVLVEYGKGGGLSQPPLFGIPFAVKDNIDVAGMETTAACPGFAYKAKVSAPCVLNLEAAGAILIGKTNMDQFATGLVGTRSPYGQVRNVFNPDFIPGGSSSGSAVAVAAGLVSFSLGTDTAGSGRIPAGLNNIVGLKPSRGLISATGVVAACRSLDCVSVFALTCDDANRVFTAARSEDPSDPFSRQGPKPNPEVQPNRPAGPQRQFKFAIPDPKHLQFFGNEEAVSLFKEACLRMEALGGTPVEIPFGPFTEAAALLYQGPWLAERQASFGTFLDQVPEQVLPVIREVMARAKSISAVAGFNAYYRLKALKAQAWKALNAVEFLIVPTAPVHYSLAEVAAEPLLLNTRLGYYTNFVNLFDLSALAIPAAMRANGLPFGITLIAKTFQEDYLTDIAGAFHEQTHLTLGATKYPLPEAHSPKPKQAANGLTRIAVAGLHLSGQPLNHQLTDLHATLVEQCHTAPCYRFYALTRGDKMIPGLVRVNQGGSSIEVEVWELSHAALGAFMENVKPPLCIGTMDLESGAMDLESGAMDLESGAMVKGFLCEPYAVETAVEITHFAGWRAYLAGQSS